SWGVSTRLIGALIMAHSDDAGLVLPPKLAPIQVVVVPIFKTDEEKREIDDLADDLIAECKKRDISIKFDDRDTYRPGYKFAEWELKGVPIRVTIGARDLKNGLVEIARRDTQSKETINKKELMDKIVFLLDDIQKNIYNKALTFRDEKITQVNSYDEFKEVLEEKGGFLSAHWDGTVETEKLIKDETKATIRCIPLDNPLEEGVCIYSGKPSTQRVLFAKAY
ncbi:MAG TPA: His/Gly/Thr/Pro-type tRNA ligase C-terminal domain-containing protein, partial [Sphingobacteriaceae bacterium]|nr:His/Gly/Thr/Pro-type tRNA ligase C-terminal domain-containing protein [Sphingobacteriaceae bacterium]